jgi:hypothetical protein
MLLLQSFLRLGLVFTSKLFNTKLKPLSPLPSKAAITMEDRDKFGGSISYRGGR